MYKTPVETKNQAAGLFPTGSQRPSPKTTRSIPIRQVPPRTDISEGEQFSLSPSPPETPAFANVSAAASDKSSHAKKEGGDDDYYEDMQASAESSPIQTNLSPKLSRSLDSTTQRRPKGPYLSRGRAATHTAAPTQPVGPYETTASAPLLQASAAPADSLDYAPSLHPEDHILDLITRSPAPADLNAQAGCYSLFGHWLCWNLKQVPLSSLLIPFPTALQPLPTDVPDMVIEYQVKALLSGIAATSPDVMDKLENILETLTDGRKMFPTLYAVASSIHDNKQASSQLADRISPKPPLQPRFLTEKEGMLASQGYQQQITNVCRSVSTPGISAVQKNGRIQALASQLSAELDGYPCHELSSTASLPNHTLYKYYDQLLHNTLASLAESSSLSNNWNCAPEALGHIPDATLQYLLLSTSLLLSPRNCNGIGRYSIMLRMLSLADQRACGTLCQQPTLLQSLFMTPAENLKPAFLVTSSDISRTPQAVIGAETSILSSSGSPVCREAINRCFSQALKDIKTALENGTLQPASVTLGLKASCGLNLHSPSDRTHSFRRFDHSAEKTRLIQKLNEMSSRVELLEDILAKQARYDLEILKIELAAKGKDISQKHLWHLSDSDADQQLRQTLIETRVSTCLAQGKPVWGVRPDGYLVPVERDITAKKLAEAKYCGYLHGLHLDKKRNEQLSSLLSTKVVQGTPRRARKKVG